MSTGAFMLELMYFLHPLSIYVAAVLNLNSLQILNLG